MNKMKNVPEDLITGKDLDYLSDMFQWNYIAYKKTCTDIENVTDDKIVELFNEAIDIFENGLNTVLSVVANPGGEIDE